MVRDRRVARATALAAAVALFGVPNSALAQSCAALPGGENELWVAAGSEWGGERSRLVGNFSFNAISRLIVGVQLTQGGYETGLTSEASSYGFGIGAVLSTFGVVVCPSIGRSATSFSYEGRFGVDRGEVADEAAVLSVPVGGRLGSLIGVQVGWWLSPEVRVRRRVIGLRETVVSTGVEVLVGESREHWTHFEGRAALSLRRGRLGVAAGAASTVTFERELIGFVQVGFVVNGR